MSRYHNTRFGSDSLPISHVYIPTTFNQTVGTFFHKNPDEHQCLVLGKWELRSGKPGKHGKRFGEEGIVSPSPFTFSSGVVTRRESSSRMKQRDDGLLASPSTAYSGSLEEFRGVDLSRAVFAINIVGIIPMKRFNEIVRCSNDCEYLQVIGKVQKEFTVTERRNPMAVKEEGDDCVCPFMYFCFIDEDGGGCNLSIEAMGWKEQHFYPKPSRLIMFYYDPEEFQKWKIPDGYPLGLPLVFLNGLTCIQNGDYHSQPDFYPAFPKVAVDHQDLLACSEFQSSSFFVSNPVLNFITSRSSGLQQILHKTCILIGTILRVYPLLPVLNFLFLLMVDSLIGYLITRYLLQLPNMMSLLHTTVDQMLAKLNHLLKWLRGAPAGLKLNPNLNSLYWRFFSYHIHLWANYIGILEPIFAVILYTIQYFGVLGATIQISLLKDLLSLATFHVYCLYIYATRLYSLQTTAIKALCRVFFGRKYNPLRKRIDSVQLTTPELFLSSFGFVILIFLFPTTMVYYTGFVFLRVPVLLIERLLQYLVITYNKLPIISWILVYLKSPRVADEIYLVPSQTTLSSSNDRHAQKRTFMTFQIRLQSTRTLFKTPNMGSGIKNIVSSVIDGTVLKD